MSGKEQYADMVGMIVPSDYSVIRVMLLLDNEFDSGEYDVRISNLDRLDWPARISGEELRFSVVSQGSEEEHKLVAERPKYLIVIDSKQDLEIWTQYSQVCKSLDVFDVSEFENTFSAEGEFRKRVYENVLRFRDRA
ncbi:MAG: hypothetical protein GOU99_00530 [Candidatus Altiarchaeota archaeon]|nr:hypothetical protein [Candidatus Altiarchaeota archaeon]